MATGLGLVDEGPQFFSFQHNRVLGIGRRLDLKMLIAHGHAFPLNGNNQSVFNKYQYNEIVDNPERRGWKKISPAWIWNQLYLWRELLFNFWNFGQTLHGGTFLCQLTIYGVENYCVHWLYTVSLLTQNLLWICNS